MASSDEQAKALVASIAEEAQKIWGDDWLPALVRTYCEIESAETGKLIKPVQRRSQIVRSLDTGNPTAPTLFRLVQAIGAELEMVVTKVDRKRF
jgi:DNA-binding phage protein